MLAKYEVGGPYQPPPISPPNGTLEYEVERIPSHRQRQYSNEKRHDKNT